MHPEQLCSEKEAVVQAACIIMLDVLVDFFLFVFKGVSSFSCPCCCSPYPSRKRRLCNQENLTLRSVVRAFGTNWPMGSIAGRAAMSQDSLGCGALVQLLEGVD